jgi:hypothetical protein
MGGAPPKWWRVAGSEGGETSPEPNSVVVGKRGWELVSRAPAGIESRLEWPA